jgi:hypothetical protein
MEKTYRLLNINVHNFEDEYYVTLVPLLEVLSKYDIISLQEVYNTDVLKEIVKGYNYTYNKGILLMTKYNIDIIEYRTCNERYTSLLLIPSIHVTIFVTSVHNKLYDENVQQFELEEILEKISGYTAEYPSILLGSFSSDTLFSEWSDHTVGMNNVYTKHINTTSIIHPDLIQPLINDRLPKNSMKDTIQFRI